MPETIAFIELHQETNSFSSQTTSLKEFENFALYRGEEVWTFAEKYKAQAYGFRQAIRKHGKGAFQILPIYAAWAWSGGPIDREVYESFKQEAVDALRAHPEVKGIYLSLHGAMGVVGLRDPESDFLRAIREVVGDELPIGVSFDLHANVTAENVRLATFIHGYRTNPHRDHRRVGRKVGKMLVRTLRGEIQPRTHFRKMRLLKGGGWGIDFLAPMRGILQKVKRLEKQAGILDASVFWVHLWIDDEELGWSVLVTSDNQPELGDRLADELAQANWEVRDRKHPRPKSVPEAIAIARRTRIRRRLGTVIFCDVSDTVGAGAPGANTNILRQLAETAPELKSYIPVRDPEAAQTAFAASPNHELEITVGGRIDPDFNPPVSLRGRVLFQAETDWGKTAVFRHRGLHLILTELAFPGYFTEDFKKVGLNLWKPDIVVVKNLFPFRFRYWKYNRRTVNVISRGTTNIDVHQLDYQKIPRPIYPLDQVTDWRL